MAFSRRSFLKGTALAAGVVATGGAVPAVPPQQDQTPAAMPPASASAPLLADEQAVKIIQDAALLHPSFVEAVIHTSLGAINCVPPGKHVRTP